MKYKFLIKITIFLFSFFSLSVSLKAIIYLFGFQPNDIFLYVLSIVFSIIFLLFKKSYIKGLIWSFTISLSIVGVVYMMSKYDSSINFIKNLHKGEYTQMQTTMSSVLLLFIAQIFFDAPNWYEWLENWELTFNAKLSKNIFQFEMIIFNLAILIWQHFSKIIEVKKHLKVSNERLESLKTFALTADLYSLVIYIIICEFCAMLIFLVITIRLKCIRKRNIEKHAEDKNYYIFKPKNKARL